MLDNSLQWEYLERKNIQNRQILLERRVNSDWGIIYEKPLEKINDAQGGRGVISGKLK